MQESRKNQNCFWKKCWIDRKKRFNNANISEKTLQISARDEPIVEDKTMTVCSYQVT